MTLQPSRARATRIDRAQYAARSPIIALLMLATVGARAHEVVPLLPLLHPLAIVAYGGLLWLLVQSSPGAIRSARRNAIVRLTFLYFGWAAITAPFALWPSFALDKVLSSVPIAAMCLGVLLCPPDSKINDQLLSRLVMLIALMGIGTLITGQAVDGRLTTRGTLDPNDLAAVMALSFPLALGVIAHGVKRLKVLGGAAAIVFVIVVLQTGSRGGTLALVVGALVFLLGSKGRNRFVLVAACFIALPTTWALAPESFRARIMTFSDIESDYNLTAYTGRKAIWTRARGYIVDRPLMGVGIGNFPVAEGETAIRIGRPTAQLTAHNAYLQAFAELGVIGGVLFVSILWLGLRQAWTLWRPSSSRYVSRHKPELFASLCAFCASAYFLSHAYFPLFFGIVALIARSSGVISAPAMANTTSPLPSRSASARGRRKIGVLGNAVRST